MYALMCRASRTEVSDPGSGEISATERILLFSRRYRLIMRPVEPMT
jgi:hypothetical protein